MRLDLVREQVDPPMLRRAALLMGMASFGFVVASQTGADAQSSCGGLLEPPCPTTTAATTTQTTTTAASATPDPNAPCPTGSHAAYRLVAPRELPTGFRSGFYLELSPPEGPKIAPGAFTARVRATPGSTLAHPYTGSTRDRDLDYRWPLLLAPGDGPATASVTYSERLTDGTVCRRSLERTITPIAIANPRIVVGHPRVKVLESPGLAIVRVRVAVKIAARANRPVRLDVYEGRSHKAMRINKVHAPRFIAVAAFGHSISSGLGPIKVKVLYPGDFRDTWPCDDVFTTGPDDRCQRRLRKPRDVTNAPVSR